MPAHTRRAASKEETATTKLAFRITCCDCGGKVGETDCEIAASWTHQCYQCHNTHLDARIARLLDSDGREV
jgi:hypothetical protein